MSKVVTANLLSTGQVVFLTAERTWAASFGDALIYADKVQAEDGLASVMEDVERALIVEPFVADAGPDYTGAGAGSPAMSLRDTIRARGPTIDFLPVSPAARG